MDESKRVYKSVFRAVTEFEDARPFQFVKPDTFFAEKSRERMRNRVFTGEAGEGGGRRVSRELFPSLNSPPVPYAPRHRAIRNGVFIFKDQTTFPSSRNKSFSRGFPRGFAPMARSHPRIRYFPEMLPTEFYPI